MAEYRTLDFVYRQLQSAVTRATRGFEQHRADRWQHPPIAIERIEIAIGNSAAQVCVNVLEILEFGAVDVSRQVQVKIILRIHDLRDWNHPRVSRRFELARECVHDAMDVLRAETVLIAVLDEAFRGIDHEDALAGLGVVLVEDDDAGGNAGAIEEVGRQANDAFDVAAPDDLASDRSFSTPAKQNA